MTGLGLFAFSGRVAETLELIAMRYAPRPIGETSNLAETVLDWAHTTR